MRACQGGYVGQFLRVDLDSSTVSIEATPDPVKWLGPRGWNAWIAWNEVPPGTQAFDPANRLVFSVGPLVGTSAPTAGRTTVSTVAPRSYPTPMWASSSMGGYWGAELKYAGFDGIIVHGASPTPVYLLIEDGNAELVPADDLWGQGVYGTQQALKARHTALHQIIAIGPAGENRVRFATIAHRLNNVVGNAGFGGVMGSKGLKAIVVRGTGGVAIAEPQRFLDTVRSTWQLARGGVGAVGQIDQGYPVVACTHGCSVKCGTRVAIGEDRFGTGASTRMYTCNDNHWRGGTGADRVYRARHMDGTELSLPRLEGFGEVGTDLSGLIETLGMTTWVYASWGRYFAGLRELGITAFVTDAGATEELDIDDPEWWRQWMQRTAHREGVGDDYAEGISRFYDKYELGPRRLIELIEDRGSRGHGWHREGRLMEPHPSPFWEYAALLYAVSTRDVTPSTHGFFFLNGLYGYPSSPKDPDDPGPDGIAPALKRLAQRIYGSERAVYPGMEWIEHVTTWHQHRAIIKDSLGVCDWVFPVTRRTMHDREELQRELADAEGSVYGDVTAEAELLAACTGIDVPIQELERTVAERILQLERCIEVRNNQRDRDDDEAVIPHFQWPEKTDGTHLSEDAHEFRELLDRYYDLHGWDRRRGRPSRQRLEALGLGPVADALETIAPDDRAQPITDNGREHPAIHKG